MLHELLQKWANDAEVQLVDVGDYEESSDEDEDAGDGGEISELPLTSGDVQQTGRPEENGNDDGDNDVASNADGWEVSELPCSGFSGPVGRVSDS